MSDYTELKRLAEAANNMDQHYLSRARAFTDFGNATNPSAIIALVEDYDQLKAEVETLRKHAPSKEVDWCACGDGYPVNSYGAGFMDANNGVCENCDAAMSKGAGH